MSDHQEHSATTAYAGVEAHRLAKTKQFVLLVAALLVCALIWAYFAELDEVSTGQGKVVSSTREQVIESLEGGILAKLEVSQDEIVEAGQVLARLDPTVVTSNIDEAAAKYNASLAAVARLEAEVNLTDLEFPEELDAYPDLKAAETRLYDTRTTMLQDSLESISDARTLLEKELAISKSLLRKGAASTVEVIRLQRQIAEMALKYTETQADYLVTARQELAKAEAEVNSLRASIRGKSDTLSRLTVRSPVRGIVKNIEVGTIGGVIPPNGKLMDIVPLGDKLLIEVRVSPRDIAYIHPGQPASVKITAYDYAIFGSLKGEVTSISADTIRDEANPEVFYYRVYVKTEDNALVNKNGKRFPISPGMVATVDIHTGQKTVLAYLVKPLNRASEALRER
ncbi:HlyD family type I secretion periplasmic adaptor subunit [Alcanivoracaceae bacterium MT1]